MSASPSLLPTTADVSDEAAYTSLLEICTELIISEDTDNPPIHHALGVLHDLLHCDRLSGDATVLSVRAVRILLDKFTPSLRTKSRAKLVECVRAALRRMKAVAGGASRLSFTFAHTKLWELQEELLQCMAAAAQSDDAIRAALPPPEQQLSFCVSVMDVSLDVCLQALRMCCVLLRSGQLRRTDSNVVSRIRGVFREKLAALESMEVSHDWLRLLRHVTEGMVTLRAYGGGGGDAAAAAAVEAPESSSLHAEATSPAGTKTRKRKRATSSATGNTATGISSSVTAHVAEVEMWLRICEKVCATPRLDRAFRSTVFGCASTVLSGEAVLPLVTPTACVSVVAALAKELSRNARTTLAIMNPFVTKEGGTGAPASSSSALSSEARNGLADADMEEDEDQGEDLLNNGEGVKWHTPEPEWAVLVLIATLLAAAPATLPASEHMWWWVGDDDYARRFAKEDRAQLSEAFFAAGDAVQLRKRGSRVKLSIMRESQWPFANACRVVFQPIPCAYNVAGSTAPSLQAVPSRSAQERATALRKGDLKSVLEHIGGVARHDGAIAQYGRTVLLTVLLAAGPDAADVARGALRSFLADASTQLIETVSEALLRHDRAWASTLVEIGVTEAILQRSRSATPERSPVVRMLRREAASLPSTPPLLPRSATTIAEPSQLRRILQHGSREEVKELLCALTSVSSAWHTVACVEAVDEVAAAAVAAKSVAEQDRGISAAASAAGAVAWVRQLEHLVAGMVLSHLQDVAQQCQPLKGLKETVEEAEVVEVELCPAGRSPAFCCPQRHPLHHFHSANWLCNACGAKGQHSAWSCRQCDYDLCGPCALLRCNRAEGAVTATAQDVLARVRADMQPQQPQETASQLSSGNLLELFTEDGGLISGATPLACLHQRRVHVARLCQTCPCGVVCPGPVRAAATSATTAARSDVLAALLRAFGGPSGRDVAVQRCLLRAYESAGLFIFLGGAGAVSLALQRVTCGLAPHLPLAVKHLITRYVAVECRRFAFQVLHNQSAVVMSTVTGVTAESTKNHRLEVPREDKAAMVALLYDGFRGLLSPVLRVEFTFAGEEGFGSGPSQELYTELSAYFSAESRFWFLTEDDGGADAVRLPFPSATALFLKEFFVLGAACGRAFVDDFRMNLNLLPEAWELLRLPSLGLLLQHEEGENAVSVDTATALLRLLEVLDPALHRTFAQLRATPESELAAMELEMDNGTAITTHAALEQHIGHTILARYEIALENLRQFQWGLLSVLELPALAYLNNEELSAVVCGADTGNGEGPLFTEDELRMQTMAGNGYSSDSPHVEMFISIVGSELSRAQQRDFLEFLTGSPRLPFNGLAGLGRHISVAMRDMEGKKELTLPSCNTCFLYLKLPPYSTREIMKARLLFAITEGRRYYSLS